MIGFEKLNLHAIIPSSRVNGPGERVVVFFQGCRRSCPGCFNPETHPEEPRLEIDTDEVFERFFAAGTAEGLTVSGGEPFLQPAGLRNLLEAAKKRGLSTVVYTGFSLEEVGSSPEKRTSLPFIDVLVDNPYDERFPEKTLLARGSTNQNFHFLTGRYGVEDFILPAKAEITIASDGTVTGSGFSRVLVPATDRV